MNVKTIVTIALIGLLGVGTAAGIFLSDRSQQQEPPSADIQQEEKEEAPVESSSQKEEEQEQSSQETKQQQLAEEFAKEKEEYYLLLANAENPLPQDWSIQTEEVQNGYEMDKRAAPAMREMIQAAKEDGVELMLCSAYRSVKKQQQLFDRSQQAYMAQGMSEEEAYAKTATETAIPGTSEHQTGLAADIVTPTYQMLDAGFADTPAGQRTRGRVRLRAALPAGQAGGHRHHLRVVALPLCRQDPRQTDEGKRTVPGGIFAAGAAGRLHRSKRAV